MAANNSTNPTADTSATVPNSLYSLRPRVAKINYYYPPITRKLSIRKKSTRKPRASVSTKTTSKSTRKNTTTVSTTVRRKSTTRKRTAKSTKTSKKSITASAGRGRRATVAATTSTSNKPRLTVEDSSEIVRVSRATASRKSPLQKAAKPRSASVGAARNDDRPMWDLLPTVPAELVFSFLRTNGNCADLANLRKVSHPLKRAVDSYMSRPCNHAEFKSVELRMEGTSLALHVQIYPANVPFHNWGSLDYRFVTRASTGCGKNTIYTLKAIIVDMYDPWVDGLRGLLAIRHRVVLLSGLKEIMDFATAASLLMDAKVDEAHFKQLPALNDAVGALLTSCVKHISASRCEVHTTKAQLSDPAAFLTGLDALLHGGLRLVESDRKDRQDLLGLSREYWEAAIAQKVQQAAVGRRVRVDDVDVAATTSDVDLMAADLNSVEW